MKRAASIWGALGLVADICIAEGKWRTDVGGWAVDGKAVEATSETTFLGLLAHLPILAGANVTVTQTETGTVVSASRGGVTNRYGWMPADYLYQAQKETLSNPNGQAVFTRHSMSRTDLAGPVSCPTPEGYTSNMTCRWYAYHTETGTYAMACRWRVGGLNAWVSATSGLFEASTSLTNLSTASLSVIAPAGGAELMDLEYWMVPTNAPGGGTAGGTGYVRGIEMVYGDRL